MKYTFNLRKVIAKFNFFNLNILHVYELDSVIIFRIGNFMFELNYQFMTRYTNLSQILIVSHKTAI